VGNVLEGKVCGMVTTSELDESPSIKDKSSKAVGSVESDLPGANPTDSCTRDGGLKFPISLLTGGSDRPYVYGLTNALIEEGASVEIIGSDELDLPEFRGEERIQFLNFRGSLLQNSTAWAKVFRILTYYRRLVWYAVVAKPKLFHILWNNKFEIIDRTLLVLWYRSMGRKVVLTAHNINTAKRDGKDSWLNRLSLRIQYRLVDHIFVHTGKMKSELVEDYGASAAKVTVIPFGINNAAPKTDLAVREAKRHLGLNSDDRVLLFFGRIAPYKGLDILIAAFNKALEQDPRLRLIVAGRPDRCPEYWSALRESIRKNEASGNILLRAEFIPDSETEVYFKAADALVLPYREIYQSGVMFLSHSFGLPVLASDVGSLRDEIIEGETGYLFRPEDASDLSNAIERYFKSNLFEQLDEHRIDIGKFAHERHSWQVVGQITAKVYESLLKNPAR